MAQYSFGSGFVFGVRTDIANASPVSLGVLQDVSVDISGDLKGLYGSNQFPLAFGRGKSKCEIKAKAARLSGAVYNALYFGATLTAGQIGFATAEAATIPATTPFTVTAVNSATWTNGLSVFYANTGIPLTQVAASPTTGQYTVSAGVYTFATADAGLPVFVNYAYTISSTGSLISVANPVMGAVPTVQLWLPNSYGGKGMLFKLNNCSSSKLSFATKQDDWLIPEIDFEAAADASGQVMQISFVE